MYTINPGLFRSKFKLQELKLVINDDNIPVEKLIDIWEAKGRVRSNTASNEEIEDGERTSITKIITARFPKHLVDFDVEDTNKYKVVFNNKTYKIVSMSNIQEMSKYIQIKLGVID